MPLFVYDDNGTEHFFIAPDIDAAKRDAMRDDVREITDEEKAQIEADARAAMAAEAGEAETGTDGPSEPEAGAAGDPDGLTPVGDPAARLDALLSSGDGQPTFPPGVVGTDPDA